MGAACSAVGAAVKGTGVEEKQFGGVEEKQFETT